MGSNEGTFTGSSNSDRIDFSMASLPPTEPEHPTSENDAKTDAHNASILAVRGLHTTAKGTELFVLAESVSLNDEIFLHVSSSAAKAREEDNTFELVASKVTFEPFYFFFYGTLRIPRVLRSTCKIPGADRGVAAMRRDASLRGWKIMMWGPYPALLPADDEEEPVPGSLWWCDRPEYVARLCRYETAAYRLAYCDVSLPTADGCGVDILENVRTFVSTLEEDQLGKGEFDLDDYEACVGSP
ncbi:hypothetical protein GGS21DRAFT_481591 [Xylaria nigripes]|nr:hypothetical protein GGS21DRAFT_481591 [Xylaria nigripes]